MANSLLTIDMVTRAALEIAHEKCTFLSTINRDYDDSFANGGAKIGSTLRIRQPNQYSVRSGSRVMDIQEQSETAITATVATQDGVDMHFNSAELSLSIDDFAKRYLEPAVSVLVSKIESDVLIDLTKGVYQSTGTAGTVVGASNDITALGNARAKLNQQLAPKDGNRSVQLDSVTMGSVSNAVKAWFEPGLNKKAFTEGLVGRSAMCDFYENERTYSHTTGADHTTVTINDGSIASGDTTLVTSGGTVTVGTVFTMADVYDVHPETKASYSHLKQFVVTAVSGAGGSQTITFSPAIISTGAKQNISTLPVTTAALTFVGSASTSYRNNLMYHKDFATFITADLPLMADAHLCSRRDKDGLSMRVWQGSDIINDRLLMRLDILYGWKLLRPEWACRITN